MSHENERDADAHDPLIADDHEQHQRINSLRHEVGSNALANAGRTVWLLTCSAGISGILFGYDTGVISSTLVSIHSDLSRPLTTTDKSLITAITSLAALVFAPATGPLADRYGRKSVIFIADLLFTVGAVLQAFASHVWLMVVGRALVGAAVGLASGATPLYITELSPTELRGRLVTIQSLFITGGQVVAYMFGWALASTNHGWRFMVGLGALPAIIQLALLVVMPETPRYLMQSKQEKRAEAVLHKIYSCYEKTVRERKVDYTLSSIRAELLETDKMRDYTTEDDSRQNLGSTRSIYELLRVPGNRRALTIACLLQGVQQLCGFNVLLYFSASIFALVGFDSPIATSMSVAVTNFVFTIVAFAFIDTVGRRNVLLRSMPVMILALTMCAVAFHFIYPTAKEPSSWMVYDTKQNTIWPRVLLVSLVTYVAAYAFGLGVVPWQQSELFPLRVRSLGSGLATATNWAANALIGITFLPMMEALTPTWTFALYGLICAGGWICIWLIYPETAGLELEGIGELLRDGYGVKESIEGFRARRRETREASTRS